MSVVKKPEPLYSLSKYLYLCKRNSVLRRSWVTGHYITCYINFIVYQKGSPREVTPAMLPFYMGAKTLS